MSSGTVVIVSAGVSMAASRAENEFAECDDGMVVRSAAEIAWLSDDRAVTARRLSRCGATTSSVCTRDGESRRGQGK